MMPSLSRLRVWFRPCPRERWPARLPPVWRRRCVANQPLSSSKRTLEREAPPPRAPPATGAPPSDDGGDLCSSIRPSDRTIGLYRAERRW